MADEKNNNNDRAPLIRRFMEITGEKDVNTATFAMEAGGYDLSVSTDLFFSGGGLLDNRGEEGGRGGEGEGGFRMMMPASNAASNAASASSSTEGATSGKQSGGYRDDALEDAQPLPAFFVLPPSASSPPVKASAPASFSFASNFVSTYLPTYLPTYLA